MQQKLNSKIKKQVVLMSKDAFFKRFERYDIAEEDLELIDCLYELNEWLQCGLKEKTISISRLKQLYGIKTEKQKKNRGKKKSKKKQKNEDKKAADEANEAKETTDSEAETEVSTETADASACVKPQSRAKGQQGRNSHLAYQINAEKDMKSGYQAGDPCPEACGGKLKLLAPKMIIKISGQSLAQVTRYNVETLRCSLCDLYVSAELPHHFQSEKYDSTFKSLLCLHKYYLGVPSYRLAGYQSHLGVPLPDSTQWDLIKTVSHAAYPVFKHLEEQAANCELTYADDTHFKILIDDGKKKPTRKGTFSTALLACRKPHSFCLFYTGHQHAGENLSHLLLKRAPTFQFNSTHMCDALASNMPSGLPLVYANCLAHARRKFFEIKDFYEEECELFLEQFALIYKNESEIKAKGLFDQARQAYHLKHSKPSVKALYRMAIDLIQHKKVESNDSLGKACRYLINHARELTLFLRRPGVPLDNNAAERALKFMIRLRKNSLFFKTHASALVGSVLMSLIYSCVLSKVNPVDYLTALQEQEEEVRKFPDLFLPWNYKDRHQKAAA